MQSNHKSNLFLVIIDGPMGSGKTTTSKLLNEKLQGTARVALSDVKRFISGFDKDHKYNKISQEIILVMVDEYLKRGISVVVEWAMKVERVEIFKEIAKKYDARCFVYQFYAPKELLINRVKERTRSLLGVPQLAENNIKNIEDNFENNYNFHKENRYRDAIVFDSEKMTPEQMANQISDDVSVTL